ncbi:MAG: hypothetical protein CL666_00480 [Balneola sp.]|nr:hypothetical protein [Balneola sp.]|tara:strand:+ start:59850 stop:61124 length:1275 start_codon:yes stop_codon:yes gene_type:complete
MKRVLAVFLLFVISFAGLYSCDEILGTKGDSTTDEIFEQGRQDPSTIVDEVAYAALVPFWTGFDAPTDVYVGYDELVYVTDAQGVHVLDRAGNKYDLIEIEGGATSVTQDRLLNLYVTARYDTVITAVDPDITWNLPAVYKIANANGSGPVQFVDTLVHPFMDNSRANTNTQQFRLDRDRSDNEEFVELTGVTVLANNDIYVSRRGPRNRTGEAIAPDNTVLRYTENSDGKLRNIAQVRALNPNNPSFLSGISITDISSFIGPPQRENMSEDISFLITQGAPEQDIPFRTLWVNAVETIDGIEYRPNSSLLDRDTSRAESFLYDEYKFKNPTGIAFSADARGHIFIVDAETDSLYMFQSNGFEGINPPPGSTAEKAINVSFGGTGNGPRQFNNPMGVAYFDEVVLVADTDNNRIARYKLTTDFE